MYIKKLDNKGKHIKGLFIKEIVLRKEINLNALKRQLINLKIQQQNINEQILNLEKEIKELEQLEKD